MPWIEFGPPDGIPVLIIPGLTDGLGPVSEPEVAQSIAPPPAEWEQVRVLVTSHRHPVARGTTTRRLAADVAAFCHRVLDRRPALIAAHSMGAMVAMHLAVDHPELAPRMVLSAAAAFPDDSFVRHVEYWAGLVEDADWRGFARAACQAAYTGEKRDEQLAAIDLVGPPDATHLAGRHLALTDAALTHDIVDQLDQVTQPTLLLGGTEDPVVTPAAVERVAAALPDATVRWFEGLAHGFPEQDRAGYLEALRAFLVDTPVAARP